MINKSSKDDANMTNSEYDKLMALTKVFVKENINLPRNGEFETYDLESRESRDKFYLDIDRRGRIELSKFKLQNRYAVTKQPLVRVDIDSPPHRNPDGTVTSRNHIHIYRETDNDTGNLPWAYDLETIIPMTSDQNNINFMTIFSMFCEYCNICIDNAQGVI